MTGPTQQALLSGGSVLVNPSIQKVRTKFIKKLTPLRLARGTCIRGHPHASTIVPLLVGGMKLPYKNYRM